MTLTDFLLARIAEDEVIAREPAEDFDNVMSGYADRVLAECDVKRRIIEMVPELLGVLCALALPYADHPDYRDEWRL